jgi:hypothetical protein
MADQPGFQKAYLEIEDGEKIDAWFNPKEYTLAWTNKWEVKPVPGAGLPSAQFTGSDPQKLNIELLFDDSDAHTGSVMTIAEKLKAMMKVDTKFGTGGKNNARPPMVTFGWGKTVTFKAVVDTLSLQFTLFGIDGTPIRALAKFGLTQTQKPMPTKSSGGKSQRQNPPPQNPVLISPDGLRSHMVRDGDSLQSIAYAAYGDATQWRVIAEANGIDDPVHLRRGNVLVIPRLAE